MSQNQYNPLFRFLRLFTNITDIDASFIEEHLVHKYAADNETLLQEGRIAKQMFFICQGILKITSVNEKGNNITQFFLKENQFCTILNSFTNGTIAAESIVAACDAELVVFTKEGFKKVCSKLSYFQPLIDSITQQALLDKIAIRNSYMGEDAATRYRKFIQRQPEIALRVALSDVASYLGITQQSLSRIRRNMK